jgi:hypothetical protein
VANLSRFQTATEIINQVAVEIGLNESTAPFSDVDPIFKQMIALLSSAGQDLVHLADWPILSRIATFTTATGDTGVYDLPADFSHMIPQTAWQQSTRLPVTGSLSPVMWEYLVGSGIGTATIYASFRESRGELWLYPQPPAVGVTITFEYISRGWVYNGAPPQTSGDAVVPVTGTKFDPTKLRDTIQAPSDLVLFDPRLMQAMLKVRTLGARGFNTVKAQDEFDSVYESVTSHKESSPVLSMYPAAHGTPLAPLNVPDTGFGS